MANELFGGIVCLLLLFVGLTLLAQANKPAPQLKAKMVGAVIKLTVEREPELPYTGFNLCMNECRAFDGSEGESGHFCSDCVRGCYQQWAA
jgi:hypothetical protein